MRYAKYKFDLMLQKSQKTKHSYNNTLRGHSSKDPSVSSDPNYALNDPFEIFNDPSHKNLVILNRFLIRPAYAALKNQLKNSIDSSLNTFQTIYIVVFSIFLTSLVVIYLFVWMPFENGLNQTVKYIKLILSFYIIFLFKF